MESSSIEIKLNRTDRVYNPGEIVEGVCYLNCFKGWSHNGLCLVADGIVHMHSPEAGATLSLEGSEKMVLFQYDTELIPKGSLPHGTVELPFRFELTSRNDLVESYHGVYVSVIYNIGITCDRGMMKKSLKKEQARHYYATKKQHRLPLQALISSSMIQVLTFLLPTSVTSHQSLGLQIIIFAIRPENPIGYNL